MADFRHTIQRLQRDHTKPELIDSLADRLGERPTSVNPLTEAMFARIAPNHHPIGYAQKSPSYSEELQPVAKNAVALKLLLHEQVGRPRYERILRLTKRDFAECIAAVDAHDDGIERAAGTHVPTTLPQTADQFVSAPPMRTRDPEPPLEAIVRLKDDYQSRITEWLYEHPDLAAANYYVYVLDCTPAVGEDENPKVRELRRAVQTKVEAGIPAEEFALREQAAYALNDNQHIYYVGSTQNIAKRVHEHVVGTAKSGVNFTTTIPPQRLVEVHGCQSRADAETLEGDRAQEIHGQPRRFAYSDEMDS